MAVNKEFNAWTYAHLVSARDTELQWPSESLIRLFKGKYIPGADQRYKGKKALEVGVGNGNNLVFLHSLGLSLYGTEVSAAVCRMAQKRLAQIGIDADLRVGTNRRLPFASNTFDYLVSWYVIHYEKSLGNIEKAIAEYRRVLKPGGRFFVATTGPGHLLLKGAKKVSPHFYRIQRKDDFRCGHIHFSFGSEDYARRCFGKKFRDVRVGRVRDFMMTETLDWFLVTGVK